MKLTFGLTALLLACAVNAQAQGAAFGLKAGINVANLSVKDVGDTFDPSNRTGFLAGVFMRVPAGRSIAFQPEVLLSRQGAKFTDGIDSAKINLDYLQIPLLARITPGGSPVGFVVGPSLGFRTAAKLVTPGIDDEDVADQIKRSDVGLVAGITADVSRLVLDGRYTWGLSNVGTDSSDTSRVRNRVVSLTVGLRF